MSEALAAALFWLVILIPLGVFARQMQQVRRGARSRLKGTLLFFSYSILPVSIYVLVFLLLVGVEELAKVPLIPEEFARTLLPVVGIGVAEVLLLTAVFAIALRFMRAPRVAA